MIRFKTVMIGFHDEASLLIPVGWEERMVVYFAPYIRRIQ